MRWIVVLVLVGVLIAGGAWALRPAQPDTVQARLAVAEALQAPSDAGYARAVAPRQFTFPQDNGPHPEFRTEWWYYTGNLESDTGERLGYELTFFRQALAPQAPDRASDWATRQVYMAHFAVTRAPDGFASRERLSRGAAGLAGAQADPYHVWLETWEAVQVEPGLTRLRAADGPIAVDLTLRDGKPVVLQGNAGLSQKSEEPGNASYYYSLTRMPTDGSVTFDGQTYKVSGSSWFDREFGTSALGPEVVGWDWFALQLDDGRDVMFYQLRRKDGSIEPVSGGTLVAPDGTSRRLSRDEVKIDTLATWQSPRTGAVYPARWRFQVPSAGIAVDITPVVADQELDVSFAYWEGAVNVAGSATGRGYIEMTGYAAPQNGQDSVQR
ncbi:MAG: lipocalin-like domain-containing protein [Anaerolineae bacterium]